LLAITPENEEEMKKVPENQGKEQNFKSKKWKRNQKVPDR
jgi:hypothetical protein